ncbi:hypothetical protein Hanom_Chr13g01186151 [Helianthus anomalus]
MRALVLRPQTHRKLQCECNTLKFTRWSESENPKSNMGLILSPNRCSKRSVQDIKI